MDNIKRVDHVAIVVEDIEAALGFWRDGLGLEVTHVEDVPDQESVVAFLPTGDSEVELVKPTSADSGVARFLGRRGPGIHHICFEVGDLEANLQRLQERGIRLINTQPVIGTAGKKIAFIHPESTHGVLVELYEMTGQEPEIRLARARTLSDRVVGESQVMVAGVLGFLRALRDGRPNPAVDARRSAGVGTLRD
ncbi:MAG TPA: methylmalonyl-CoA epimerase [Anaerolineales bacterium]|nr:methylmalonyl-CoA epimerase [Anaerolineales bacterium]